MIVTVPSTVLPDPPLIMVGVTEIFLIVGPIVEVVRPPPPEHPNTQNRTNNDKMKRLGTCALWGKPRVSGKCIHNLISQFLPHGMEHRTIKLASCICALLLASVRVHAERYALLIGINVYANAGIPSLSGAAADAKSLAKTLVESDGFPKENIHVLVSEKRVDGLPDDSIPTKINISKQLDWLTQVVKTGDTVFIFYAGHGAQFQKQAWLLPYDTDNTAKIVFQSSALSSDEIKKLLDLPPCLLVTAYDMCRREQSFSHNPASRGLGFGFRLGDLQERSVSSNTAKTSPAFEGGSVSLFACTGGEYSWESRELGRGFFSQTLEAAISHTNDANGNLTIGGIIEYVHNTLDSDLQAQGLSEHQRPDAQTSSEEVRYKIFATGLPPMPSSPKRVPHGVTKSRASDLNPRGDQDEYLAWFQAGYRLYKADKFAEAQTQFENALAIMRTPAVLRLIGDCRYFQNDVPGARNNFNDALKIDPKYSPAYSDLGYLEDYHEHNPKAAVAYYLRAIECDPDNPQPVNNISRPLHELRRYNECLEMCRKAVDLDPNNGLYEANLALELLKQRKRDEALIHARSAQELGLKRHDVFKKLRIELPDK